jgi:hypothetical protein
MWEMSQRLRSDFAAVMSSGASEASNIFVAARGKYTAYLTQPASLDDLRCEKQRRCPHAPCHTGLALPATRKRSRSRSRQSSAVVGKDCVVNLCNGPGLHNGLARGCPIDCFTASCAWGVVQEYVASACVSPHWHRDVSGSVTGKHPACVAWQSNVDLVIFGPRLAIQRSKAI